MDSTLLAPQTVRFLVAVVLGLCFGLCAGVSTAAGELLRLRRWGQTLLDAFCAAFCAVCAFGYLLTCLSGEVRAYPMVGMLLGALIWNRTVGALHRQCIRALHKAAARCRRVLRRIRPARPFGKIMKKTKEKCENSPEKLQKPS